jgi:predicted SprT family Zn-dependent metalloprotease
MEWDEFTQKLNDKMDKTFKPTVDWMTAKYAEMNDTLFNGALGECSFAIFTTGKGSEGGVLGWFKINGRNIRADRYSRRMFVKDMYGGKTFIDRKNFVALCNPTIELNGNYTGTEHGFLATLVHEMCHYYTYMHGYCPKQGHGPEFREIGYVVSSRSNGMFTIQRIASAEQMTELELNDEMKAKREKRLANKKASVTAVIVFAKNGKVKLTISSNKSLINMIESSEKERGENVAVTNDAEVIEYLFSKGYKQNLRTWRYWSLEGKPWLDELKSMLLETSGETLGAQRPMQPQQPKIIFSIKTNNGVFETECNSFMELRNKLQERFPKMSYDAITKIMNNKANFKKMEENKMNANSIIKEVVDEFMRNEFRGANNMEDDVTIDPNMNLGLHSPLEVE